MQNLSFSQTSTQEIYPSLQDVYAVFTRHGLTNDGIYEIMQDILPTYYEAKRRNIPVRFIITFTPTDTGGIFLLPSVQVWKDEMKMRV